MKGEGRGKKFSGMMFLKKIFEGRGGEDFEEKFFLMMVSEKNFFSSSCLILSKFQKGHDPHEIGHCINS